MPQVAKYKESILFMRLKDELKAHSTDPRAVDAGYMYIHVVISHCNRSAQMDDEQIHHIAVYIRDRCIDVLAGKAESFTSVETFWRATYINSCK